MPGAANVDPTGNVPYMSVLRGNTKVARESLEAEAPGAPPMPKRPPKLVERVKQMGYNVAEPGTPRN